MQNNQVHIQCELLGDSIFPNEVAVQIETVDSNPVSVLVDNSLLEAHDSEHFLRAVMIESKDSVSVCLLPTETESGSRWVRVQNSSVLEKRQELQVA